ncbi:MAG: class I SAM-dependent methyltransferase, partial [Planctomycetota bacterium]
PERVAKPRRILELGCGTGNLSLAIAKRFPEAELTAIDLSQSSLDIHAQRFAAESDVGAGTVNRLCRDMRELNFGDESFDLILSTIALHHLTSEEKQKLFHSCNRWLLPNGVLSYSDQFAGDSPELYQQHMTEWKQASTAIGATEEEWEMWMQHQAEQDHHDSLPNQLGWLKNAGFHQVDCVWRHILWTVVTASKRAAAES